MQIVHVHLCRSKRIRIVSAVPFLDRIDLCVEASQVKYEHLSDEQKGESSKEIRKEFAGSERCKEYDIRKQEI